MFSFGLFILRQGKGAVDLQNKTRVHTTKKLGKNSAQHWHGICVAGCFKDLLLGHPQANRWRETHQSPPLHGMEQACKRRTIAKSHQEEVLVGRAQRWSE